MNNTVFIIDDDAAVRDSLGLLLGLRGYPTTMFADAAAFLNALKPDWSGCLLIDIRMPGMDGLALQRELARRGSVLPTIIITGHGDVSSAREAFRAEAVDFLEKPLDEPRLFAAIDEALARLRSSQESQRGRQDYRRRLATLTPREKEVMNMVVLGRHNREIAEELGISVRTVEVHKSRVMSKLEAGSIPELVRASLGAESPTTDRT